MKRFLCISGFALLFIAAEVIVIRCNRTEMTADRDDAPKAQEETSSLPLRPLQIVPEPFLFQGSYYLKLSLKNPNRTQVTVTDTLRPAWTEPWFFTILADGERLSRATAGVHTFGSKLQLGIPAKTKRFFGVIILAGRNKANLLGSYSTDFNLAPDKHEIQISADNVPPTSLTVTIPDQVESLADKLPPNSHQPLQFSLATAQFSLAASKFDSTTTELTIYVANESTNVWHYPYRGNTPLWVRSNWYQLLVDGKVVKPHRNWEHKDKAGHQEIPRMRLWYASR
jgi:hypothetical protein